MKKWAINGLVLLLAAAILAVGFFGIDVVKSLFPSGKDKIVTLDAAGNASLLYVDAQEELIFYPWTIYEEQESVPYLEYIRTHSSEFNEDAETAFLEQSKEWDGFVAEICSYWDSAFYPQTTPSFSLQWQYQASVEKFFLSGYEYPGQDGRQYLLDLVWDGMVIESMHITPKQSLPALSNDERIQRTETIEKAIETNRAFYKGELADPYPSDKEVQDEPVRDAWVTPSLLLDDFLSCYSAFSQNTNPFITESILPHLLYEGAYHMIFYGGEILLFFLPETTANASMVPLSADKMTGLLLYVNPQNYHLNGFSVLNLAA